MWSHWRCGLDDDDDELICNGNCKLANATSLCVCVCGEFCTVQNSTLNRYSRLNTLSSPIDTIVYTNERSSRASHLTIITVNLSGIPSIPYYIYMALSLTAAIAIGAYTYQTIQYHTTYITWYVCIYICILYSLLVLLVLLLYIFCFYTIQTIYPYPQPYNLYIHLTYIINSNVLLSVAKVHCLIYNMYANISLSLSVMSHWKVPSKVSYNPILSILLWSWMNSGLVVGTDLGMFGILTSKFTVKCWV